MNLLLVFWQLLMVETQGDAVLGEFVDVSFSTVTTFLWISKLSAEDALYADDGGEEDGESLLMRAMMHVFEGGNYGLR